MEKRELLLKVLKKMEPYRDLAEGMSALLQSSYIDEQAIDGLIHIFAQSIKKVKTGIDKSRLEKGLMMVQKIRAMEADESISTEELDKLLEDI